MDAATKENLIRKKLARDPSEIQSWADLFGILLGQFNFSEVELMTRRSLEVNHNSYPLKLVCLNALLNSLNFTAALNFLRDDGFCKFLGQSNIAINSLYHLGMISRITRNESLKIQNLNCGNKNIQEYNRWVFSEATPRRIDVAFFLANPFHYPIQAGIAKLLQIAGYKCVFVEHLWAVAGLSPSVIVTSEVFPRFLPILRATLPGTMIVNTRHGLADKNYLAVGASNADKICVSSDSIAEFFKTQLLIDESKIWVTGFPLLDNLFRGQIAERTDHKNSILFAPTFNPSLGCLDMLQGKCLTTLIRGSNEELRVIIRPHPSTGNHYPGLIRQWENEARNYPNVIFENDSSADIANLFNQSNAMISDLSSIALSWMSTGKPLVLILNERQSAGSTRYAADGIEHQIRSAATVVNDVNHLSAKISHVLANPLDKKLEMEKYANLLFGNLRDGKAAERVAANITRMLDSDPKMTIQRQGNAPLKQE